MFGKLNQPPMIGPGFPKVKGRPLADFQVGQPAVPAALDAGAKLFLGCEALVIGSYYMGRKTGKSSWVWTAIAAQALGIVLLISEGR